MPAPSTRAEAPSRSRPGSPRAILAGCCRRRSTRRPIAEVMFADFLTLCADQLYNHAIKFPGIFPWLSVPMAIRAAAGGRLKPDSQLKPEALLTAMPGLTVIYGSHRHVVGGLLWNAVRHWPYPTAQLTSRCQRTAHLSEGSHRPRTRVNRRDARVPSVHAAPAPRSTWWRWGEPRAGECRSVRQFPRSNHKSRFRSGPEPGQSSR
jgi:hypothetical protein